MNKTEKLLEIIPENLYDYYTAFTALRDVVHCCMGNELFPDYGESIAKFEAAYKKLGISVTPKVHLLVEHALEDISLHGRGLGIFNESTSESLHADFDSFYQRYLVKDTSSDVYLKNLQTAVVAYNSNHV